MTKTKRIILITAMLLGCVGCDQVSKRIAQVYLADNQAWSFLGDTFRLQLAYNHGAFLSLGSAMPESWRIGLFSLGVGMMLLALLAYALNSKSLGNSEIWALSLLFAGGVGNLIDRVAYGFVVDFLNIGIGPLRSGIFNVADIAVSIGALLLLWGAFKNPNTSQ